MMTKEKTTNRQAVTAENEKPKSKIRLYWDDRERRGIPPGEILNMRAVLR